MTTRDTVTHPGGRPDQDSAGRPGPGASPAAPAAGDIPAPLRLRRRPMLIALALVLITSGALLAAFLVTTLSHTVPVVAVRADVPRGAQIDRGDLMVVDISPNPALDTIPGEELPALVGQYADRDLTAGSLVTPSSVTDQSLPASGKSLVGVSLTPAQLPGQPLQPGDTVRLVTTPGQQGDLPTKSPTTLAATVVSTRPVGDQGQVVVDVTVPQTSAALLAATAATGRVAIVVDSRN